jgi:adenylate kinase family enzyme
VRRRLATYASAAGPVVEFYRARHGFVAIDGLRHADVVTADIVAFVTGRGGT